MAESAKHPTMLVSEAEWTAAMPARAKAYISGPITGDPDHRTKFAYWADVVTRLGYDVVNPLDVPPACGVPQFDEWVGEQDPAWCGHEIDADPVEVARVGADGFNKGHRWECYLRGDLKAMLDCAAVFMMPNWYNSKGAVLEHNVAERVGLPITILTQVPALFDPYAAWDELHNLKEKASD